MSPDLCKVVYSRGHLIPKIVGTLSGYLQRLRDLLRVRSFDGVYVALWVTPFGTSFFERICRLLARKLIYDIDDLVFLGDASPSNRWLQFIKGKSKPIFLMKSADHVITCTPYLDNFARRYNSQTTDISSTINTERYLPKTEYSNAKRITLGWSGSHSTARYLRILAPVLRGLRSRIDFRLLVIGAPGFQLDGVDCEARPWVLEREVQDLLDIDIGLYPLPLNEIWVQGKSGLKALQYMALGIPTVATAIGANFRVIEDSVSGYLVRSETEWESRILQLADDSALRQRIGRAARARVELLYSVRANTPKYLAIWDQVYRV